MTLLELRKQKETMGYSDELIAVLSGIPLETVKTVFQNTEKHMIQEDKTPYNMKQQGEYTLEDYYRISEEIRVELIDGVIYDMSSAPALIHQAIVSDILYALKTYIDKKQGKCRVFTSPVDVQLDCDDKTMLQPDVIVVCDRDKFKKQCIYGAPDLVVEVLSPHTKKKDMTIKLEKYRKAGIKEYWMIDPMQHKILIHCFEKSEMPIVCGFDSKISVGLFGGECMVDFEKIYKDIAFLNE